MIGGSGEQAAKTATPRPPSANHSDFLRIRQKLYHLKHREKRVLFATFTDESRTRESSGTPDWPDSILRESRSSHHRRSPGSNNPFRGPHRAEHGVLLASSFHHPDSSESSGDSAGFCGEDSKRTIGHHAESSKPCTPVPGEHHDRSSAFSMISRGHG